MTASLFLPLRQQQDRRKQLSQVVVSRRLLRTPAHRKRSRLRRKTALQSTTTLLDKTAHTTSHGILATAPPHLKAHVKQGTTRSRRNAHRINPHRQNSPKLTRARQTSRSTPKPATPPVRPRRVRQRGSKPRITTRKTPKRQTIGAPAKSNRTLLFSRNLKLRRALLQRLPSLVCSTPTRLRTLTAAETQKAWN